MRRRRVGASKNNTFRCVKCPWNRPARTLLDWADVVGVDLDRFELRTRARRKRPRVAGETTHERHTIAKGWASLSSSSHARRPRHGRPRAHRTPRRPRRDRRRHPRRARAPRVRRARPGRAANTDHALGTARRLLVAPRSARSIARAARQTGSPQIFLCQSARPDRLGAILLGATLEASRASRSPARADAAHIAAPTSPRCTLKISPVIEQPGLCPGATVPSKFRSTGDLNCGIS